MVSITVMYYTRERFNLLFWCAVQIIPYMKQEISQQINAIIFISSNKKATQKQNDYTTIILRLSRGSSPNIFHSMHLWMIVWFMVWLWSCFGPRTMIFTGDRYNHLTMILTTKKTTIPFDLSITLRISENRIHFVVI